jgi:hypothetical protein
MFRDSLKLQNFARRPPPFDLELGLLHRFKFQTSNSTLEPCKPFPGTRPGRVTDDDLDAVLHALVADHGLALG